MILVDKCQNHLNMTENAGSRRELSGKHGCAESEEQDESGVNRNPGAAKSKSITWTPSEEKNKRRADT